MNGMPFGRLSKRIDAAHRGVEHVVLRVDDFGVDNRLLVVGRRHVDQRTGVAQPDRRLRFHFAVIQRHQHFFDRTERPAFAARAGLCARQVVNAEHHVLRRNGHRLAAGRRQQVLRRKHQHRRFDLRFRRQRNVHRHLIAVKIRVERGADQRMNLDRLAFNQHRLECLNSEAMQRRSAVQQNRMVLDDLFQDVPHHRILPLHHFLCSLDGRAVTALFEPVVDERLEQFERHLLRQTALMQFQLRTDDDDRTAGIIDALSEQVLAETALLAFQRIGERLQRTVVCAAQNAAAAAVVEQAHRRLPAACAFRFGR